MSNPWEKFYQKSPNNIDTKNNLKADFFTSFLKRNNNFYIAISLLLIFIFSALSSIFFIINTDELGLVLRFGKFSRVLTSGINIKFPYPIETKIIHSVSRINVMRFSSKNIKNQYNKIQTNNLNSIDAKNYSGILFLTKDENLVDLDFDIQWKIKNLQNYIFGIQNIKSVFYQAIQSSIREAIGYSNLEDLLTIKRGFAENAVKENLQDILNFYNSGIDIISVQLLKVDPPEEVIDSFRDVQTARVEKETKLNTAISYRNQIIPEANALAKKYITDAESYKEIKINSAKEEAFALDVIYNQYISSKNVSRKFMYYEALSKFLDKAKLNIIDNNIKSALIFKNSQLNEK